MSEKKLFLKAVIIGDGGVGKTSLIIRHVDKKFEKEYKPTLGFDISLKTVSLDEENASAELLIWDIGGQAIFKEIRESYLEGSHCCFLVFDLTRKETFNNIKNWTVELTRYAGDIPRILIGNKKDLENERQVSKENIEEKARAIGALDYFETSAKTGEGVDEAFTKLTQASIKYFESLNAQD
ncbi:MAG: Rab family GTPase [Candidatus Helarchaeota archaeon]